MRNSDEQRRWGTPLQMLLILVGIGFAGLFLFAASSTLTNMPVNVIVRSNPPSQFANAFGSDSNSFTTIPYARLVQKPVTENDIQQIKSVIPRSKTIARLYRPNSIAIESPTEAKALFLRRRKLLWVSLSKTGEVWRIENINNYAVPYCGSEPDFLDKLSSALPF